MIIIIIIIIIIIRIRTVKGVFKTYIDAIHFQLIGSDSGVIEEPNTDMRTGEEVHREDENGLLNDEGYF
jgi:hypothetical protein